MSTPGRLVHAAVLCSDPDELVRLTLPEIRPALEAGEPVEAVLGRRCVRAFREALPDTDVTYPSPVGASVADLVHGSARRPRVVVRTACADAAVLDPDGAALAEDTLTLLLADEPVTVLCVYDPDDPVGVALARRTHPWLVTAAGLIANPDHRPPSPTSPVPAGLFGLPVATVPVPDGSALADLRRRFALVVSDAGLVGERAEAAVLAAHEAMLLACGAELDGSRPPADLPPGDHRLDVRVSGSAVVAECHGSPPLELSGSPTDDPRFAHLRRFCDEAIVFDEPGGRTVRVLTGTR
ncbi:hypothetical protein [Actinomycetospora atypica]|uniref:Uncharacterized protein n=1 Tax=Actinomycetospora atypica TaxID=1290095 RepID=A0ABV9YKQ2_9PSEU